MHESSLRVQKLLFPRLFTLNLAQNQAHCYAMHFLKCERYLCIKHFLAFSALRRFLFRFALFLKDFLLILSFCTCSTRLSTAFGINSWSGDFLRRSVKSLRWVWFTECCASSFGTTKNFKNVLQGELLMNFGILTFPFHCSNTCLHLDVSHSQPCMLLINRSATNELQLKRDENFALHCVDVTISEV